MTHSYGFHSRVHGPAVYTLDGPRQRLPQEPEGAMPCNVTT